MNFNFGGALLSAIMPKLIIFLVIAGIAGILIPGAISFRKSREGTVLRLRIPIEDTEPAVRVGGRPDRGSGRI